MIGFLFDFYEGFKKQSDYQRQRDKDLLSLIRIRSCKKSILGLLDLSAHSSARSEAANNEALAYKFFCEGVAEGDMFSEALRALCYEFGHGVPIDYKQAEKGYLKAAKEGNFLAQTRIALMRQEGRPNVRIDVVESDRWKVLAMYKGNDNNVLEWMFKMAKPYDHPSFQCCLGDCFKYGIGMPENHTEAIKWYHKAALQGNQQAQVKMGHYYEHVIGVKRDYKIAYYWYNEAAKKNGAQAICYLGRCFKLGIGVTRNDAISFQYFYKAAKMGDAYAKFCLAICYEEGSGIEKSPQKAFYWYKKGAIQGHLMALNQLGNCYRCGIGTTVNKAKGAKMYFKAARQGDFHALAHYAIFLLQGEGVVQNIKKAVKYLFEAAKQDKPMAHYYLGRCYEYGFGVEANILAAFNCYLRSAEMGYETAELKVASCYLGGLGVKTDMEKAVIWLQKCAEKGTKSEWQLELTEHSTYGWAQFYLAEYYFDNCKKVSDFKEAFEWYQRSAKFNNTLAMEKLAYMYTAGLGTSIDTNLAAEWRLKAGKVDKTDFLLKSNYPHIAPSA